MDLDLWNAKRNSVICEKLVSEEQEALSDKNNFLYVCRKDFSFSSYVSEEMQFGVCQTHRANWSAHLSHNEVSDIFSWNAIDLTWQYLLCKYYVEFSLGIS